MRLRVEAKLTLLILLGAAFFLAIGYFEWSYYLIEGGKGLVERVAKDGGHANSQSMPRKFGSVAINFDDHRGAAGDTSIGSQRAWVSPAIVLFCFDRVGYLNQTLSSLAELPGLGEMSLYISQDGNHSGVASLINDTIHTTLRAKVKRVEHWQHDRQPLLSLQQPGHAWLSQHYKWGLDRVFWENNHSHAIVLEDDMLFSKDFLTLMKTAAPLLDVDPTLWCISSWNDNGLSHMEWRNDKLFRTSYFPGLGWMLRRQLWDELGPTFPLQAWDHWMRLDSTSKGRECIAPEVNRNKNIGERGANMQKSVFRRYLANMAWSVEPVREWGNLEDLLLERYDAQLRSLVRNAQTWEQAVSTRTLAEATRNQTWLVPYKGEQYLSLARAFHTWPFPRGHHHHTTVLPHLGSHFVLVDRRFSKLIPDALRIRPSPSLQATPGPPHTSCDHICRGLGLACKKEDFWFINTCEELRLHFPCERGCAVELGDDVPNYVVNPQLPTYQTCLVTQKEPTCSASHPDTRRLCPCS